MGGMWNEGTFFQKYSGKHRARERRRRSNGEKGLAERSGGGGGGRKTEEWRQNKRREGGRRVEDIYPKPVDLLRYVFGDI